MNNGLMLRVPAPSDHSASVGDTELQVPVRSSSRWWLLLVGLVAAMLCMPFMRTIYWLGDEGELLHGAERMLQGDRLYAEFFEFLPPGGFVLTAAWLRIVGISFASARLLAILTIVGIACFTYLACRQASKNAPLSALVTIGWVAMSQGQSTQVSHHWFTTLASMIAAWAVLASVGHPRRTLRWPLVAGLATGAAAMVTPTRGALAMLAAVTAFSNVRRQRAELIAFVLGGAVVPVGLLAYLIGHHALAAAFDDVIRLTAQRYAPIQYMPFGAYAEVQNLPLKYLFPLAALLTLLVFARDWRACLRDSLLRPCVAFGLAGFVGCYPRPDMAHIVFAVPLVCPLLAYCATWLTRWWRPAYRHVLAIVVIALCVPSVGAFLSLSQSALRAESVLTPRGDAAFVGQPGAAELLARIVATPAGNAYFFYPYMPLLPFLTAREHVSRYDIFAPGYTLASEYQDACISAVRRAAWVVIDRKWTDLSMLKKVFPAMRNLEASEMKRFERALAGSFELVAQEGTFELRHRREGISDTVCAGIAK